MKLCKVSDIVGNEKLARPIMTSNYQELLAAGTILKKEYIPKILQLGITEVYIEDQSLQPEQVDILRKDIEGQLTEQVRSVMQRHIYTDSSSLKELSLSAENIIKNILSDDTVVEKVYDIKEHNSDIYEHSISVCSLAVLVALKLKVDNVSMHNLGVACLFHDIGLRYIDFDYCDLDITCYDEKKISEYRKHPAYAYSSIEKEKWISPESKMMILQHHERLDGSGYPLHVTNKDEITSILQVCEAFDEMICGIGCKRARVYEAVEFLKYAKGTFFSANVVNTLLDFTAVYPSGTVVLLNTKELAVVLRQNKQFPERPVLQIIKDASGNMISEGKEFNLLDNNSVFIEKVLH